MSIVTAPIITKILDPGPLILIASIGNPSKYDGTRHSVGHYMLKRLIDSFRAVEVPVGRYTCFAIPEEQVEVVVTKKKKQGFQPLNSKSQILFYRCPGYMNLSGKSLKPLYQEVNKYARGVNREMKMIVLFDELDLDIGKIKTRKQGSSHRGHNGLRDIQDKIGKEYTGIQIGIGRHYDGDKSEPNVVADYVLSKFTDRQLEDIDTKSFPMLKAIIKEARLGRYINDKL